ncbi:hypothetical protein BD769DRAFT_1777056 [Suillus cothurnatus]|nr:hypothetical protein BD769DRAFT_1777056 [Suillus cothurnatus]
MTVLNINKLSFYVLLLSVAFTQILVVGAVPYQDSDDTDDVCDQMFEENPNEAIRPDFVTIEHQEARQQLVDEGLSEEQAAHSLTALWTLKNNTDKVRWAEKQERLENLQQGEEEENEQRQQALRDEEEAA